MRAVRKDYFLDHDHSAYVDQWDWERSSRPKSGRSSPDRGRARIWKVLKEAEAFLHELPRARQGVSAAARTS